MARQYTGTAGKVTNSQVGVSLSLVTDTASCPVDRRLFVPESWKPPLIVADAGYGDAAEFREELGNRNLTYLVEDTLPGRRLLARLIGTCPTCKTRFPQRIRRHRRRS